MYLLIIVGLYYFVLYENKSIAEAMLLGIVIYGAYELTTKALIKNWRWKTVVLDTVWGGVLFGLVTAIFQQYKRM